MKKIPKEFVLPAEYEANQTLNYFFDKNKYLTRRYELICGELEKRKFTIERLLFP